MEIRELRGDDVFALLAILGKLDIKDELITAFEEGSKQKKMTAAEKEKRGMRVMASLIQQILLNLNKVRGDINALLADLTGKSEKDIAALKASEYIALVMQVVKHPDLKEVFTSAVSLLTDQETGTAKTK